MYIGAAAARCNAAAVGRAATGTIHHHIYIRYMCIYV